jgi:hypothetical protein
MSSKKRGSPTEEEKILWFWEYIFGKPKARGSKRWDHERKMKYYGNKYKALPRSAPQGKLSKDALTKRGATKTFVLNGVAKDQLVRMRNNKSYLKHPEHQVVIKQFPNVYNGALAAIGVDVAMERHKAHGQTRFEAWAKGRLIVRDKRGRFAGTADSTESIYG